MTPRRRRASTGRLLALLALLVVCMWLLYKLFLAVPPAPPPEVRVGFRPQRSLVAAASLAQPRPSHQRSVFSTNSFA